MNTHRRKKLELLIEGALQTRAEAILKEVGVQVFTVLDGRESRGIHAWSDDGVMDGLDHRYIVAVTTEACAAQAFERFAVLFQRYPGVIFSSDVEVLRGEKF